jgi:flagellar biosynthesis protein FliQ
VSIFGWFVKGGLACLANTSCAINPPSCSSSLISRDVSSYTTWLAGAMNSFGKKYTMHVGAERPDPSACLLGAALAFSGSRLLQFPVPQALNPLLLAFPQVRRAPLSFLPDVLVFLFVLISPSLVSLPFPWVINDLIYFLTPIVIRMHPSNYLMDGSAIDSFLPGFRVLITALRAVPQCGKLEAFIPAVPEECASPMCTLLFPRVLFQFFPARLFLKPAPLLLVSLPLVAFFFLRMLPFVEENARGNPGLGPG